MLQYYKNGFIMGASSPSHPKGDKEQNPLGIVFQHAYSLLLVIELDDNKLIKLRNPHGQGGQEWKGDWSDKSPLWTQRLKALAGKEYSDKDDGSFFISLNDLMV